MLPDSYKKVIVHQFDADPKRALKVVDVPMEDPIGNEILVRNHYAGVNMADIARMMGISQPDNLPPFDFGAEALGEIVAVGSKVRELAAGDVVITALPGNGYKEYSRIDANFALKLPAIKPEYVGLFISGVLAKLALEYIADIQEGERVMITAALSSSGHYAAQLAKAAKCHVVGTWGNAEEVAILEDLGLDRIINRSQEDLKQVLADEYAGKLDVVYDSMGGAVLDACLGQTASRARVLLIEAIREHLRNEVTTHQINMYQQVIQRSVSIRGVNLLDYANSIPIEGMKLFDLFELGMIRSVIDPTEFVGIEQVADALAYLATGKVRGKVLVKF